MICCYPILTKNKIFYFGFNSDRKFTSFCFVKLNYNNANKKSHFFIFTTVCSNGHATADISNIKSGTLLLKTIFKKFHAW